jgi:AraC family transcriptional regulator
VARVLHRIRCSTAGRLAPIYAGEPVVASVHTPWSGFVLEVHRLPPNGSLPPRTYPHPALFLVSAGRGESISTTNGAIRRNPLEPGLVTVREPGVRFDMVAWNGEAAFELVAIELGPLPRGWSTRDEAWPPATNVRSREGIRDPQLGALVTAMRAEIEAGCPSGPMFAEAASLALAARVVACCGVRRPAQGAARGRLSAEDLCRVCEHIGANLAQPLVISDLAALVGLSAHHFAALFRAATGHPPHRYLVRKRVARSQALLASGAMSVADVASATGFASQSHFTETFKRTTGITPGQFLRRTRGRHRDASAPERIGASLVACPAGRNFPQSRSNPKDDPGAPR